jgi:glycosyltransferase involved in cell wall biosynthesis
VCASLRSIIEGNGLNTGNPLGVCWIGNPRYSKPLNPTDEKKWRLLSGLGIRMYAIAFAEDRRPRRFTQYADFYLLPAMPFSILRYSEIFLFSPFLILWLIIRHRVRVIVAQSPYEGAIGAFAKKAARLWGKKVALVVENHGDFEESVFIQRRIKLAGLYRRLMTASARFALRNADALRAISSMTERQLQTHAPGKPVHRFMTWTDSTLFRETPREKALSQTQEILYTGALIPRKGVHLLINAFTRIASAFPDACLWLVGKAENQEYAAQLENQAVRLGLKDRIHFVGAVSQSELARHMGRARVLVLPSVSEGLGRVVFEAMLCGTPVIGSRVGGIPDMIQDGVNGYLVTPGDVDALAESLRTILSDPDIEAMGQRARAFAESFFSEEAYLEGYRRLLDSVVDGALSSTVTKR